MFSLTCLRLPLLCVLGVSVMASGCGGEGRGSASDAGRDADSRTEGGASGPTLQAFCEQLREVEVARRARCLGYAPESLEELLNVDTCAAWAAAVAVGHLVYDPTEAAACLASYADRPCTGGSFGPCPGVVKGTVPVGSACQLARSFYIFSECAGDSECVRGPTATCSGTCVARAKEGEPCSNTQPCVLGGLCDARTSRCAPLPKAGEACGVPSILLCAEGLFCTDLLAGGTCMAQHPTGACQYTNECTPPAQCPPQGGVCALPPKVGDECGPGKPWCGQVLMCGANQRCEAGSLIGDVQPAGGLCNGADAQCGPNAFCVHVVAEGKYRCSPRCF